MKGNSYIRHPLDWKGEEIEVSFYFLISHLAIICISFCMKLVIQYLVLLFLIFTSTSFCAFKTD